MNPVNYRVALATCSLLPGLDPDDVPLIKELAYHGITAEPVVWDDPDIDWNAFDAVVIRSTWDYAPRRDEFVAWAKRVPRLYNAAEAIAWNTDKGYLRELEAAGVSVIPTLWLDPARNLSSQAIHTRLPAFGDFVIKPVVSAGAKDTGRYLAAEAQSRGLAIQHAKNLLMSGREVMVQPYVMSVDTAGETRLVYFQGVFSHAVKQNAMLHRGHRPTQGLYAQQRQTQVTATPAQQEVGANALAAAAAALDCDVSDFLYARADLVNGQDDAPMLIELELTEPALFLGYAPGSLDTLTRAIVALLERQSAEPTDGAAAEPAAVADGAPRGDGAAVDAEVGPGAGPSANTGAEVSPAEV